MNADKIASGGRMDERIALAGLWAARMLSGLQGDTVRLHDPAALKALLSGGSDVAPTPGLLLAMSALFVVPIAMVPASLTLGSRPARLANRIIGPFFALFDLAFLGLALFHWKSGGYEIIWALAYLAFTSLAAYRSWRWRPEAP